MSAAILRHPAYIDWPADDARDHREDQVHRPDVFVIGREQPAGNSVWRVAMVVIVSRVVRASHCERTSRSP